MAFADGVFAPLSSMANVDAGKTFTYKEDATLAAIRAANYFNNALNYGLAAGDVIMIFANDGFGFSVVAVDGSNNVTVGEGLTSA